MNKTKFVRDPQLDSEGFTDLQAPCRGCALDEACPRSGHCERYDSPLRDMDYASLEGRNMANTTPYDPSLTTGRLPEQQSCVPQHPYTGTVPDQGCFQCPWHLLDQDHLDRAHAIWQASSEKYRRELADWYYEAQTEAKL